MRINILSSVNNLWLHNARCTAIRSPLRSVTRTCSTKLNEDQENPQKFETIFSFPFVRHIATLNRMKIYHIIGATIAVPSCGLLETLNVFPEYSVFAAAYIGATGGILLSLASLPFNNTIGFLYVSEDNKFIKISTVDFWGRRKDQIIPVGAWTPLLDLKPKTMDAIYLSPQLADGTKYKLFVKFGKVLNSKKMGYVLE